MVIITIGHLTRVFTHWCFSEKTTMQHIKLSLWVILASSECERITHTPFESRADIFNDSTKIWWYFHFSRRIALFSISQICRNRFLELFLAICFVKLFHWKMQVVTEKAYMRIGGEQCELSWKMKIPRSFGVIIWNTNLAPLEWVFPKKKTLSFWWQKEIISVILRGFSRKYAVSHGHTDEWMFAFSVFHLVV